jgi:hypothetical protein
MLGGRFCGVVGVVVAGGSTRPLSYWVPTMIRMMTMAMMMAMMILMINQRAKSNGMWQLTVNNWQCIEYHHTARNEMK